jgi:hypothetical protein
MSDDSITIERTEATYERLADKLAEFASTLPVDEQSALVLLIEHAKENATNATGFEFEDVEPETAGFMIGLINMPGGAGGSPSFDTEMFTGGMRGVGQFGQISGGYMPASFGGGGAQMR